MPDTDKALGETTFRSPWLNTNDAGAYLSTSPKTLAVWRSQGKGPGYRTCGGRLILYHRDDLDAFVVPPKTR